MSYILDGLEKAEKERQMESVPGLQTVHTDYPGKRRKRPGRSLRMVGIAAVICAAAIGGVVAVSVTEKVPVSSGSRETSSPKIVKEAPGEPSPPPQAPPQETSQPVLSQPPTPPAFPEPEIRQVLPYLDELDEAVRSRLPEIKYAGHTYADTSEQRLIIINNRIVREGQNLEEGLTLVEITWEGIVLDYEGIRFRVMAARQ